MQPCSQASQGEISKRESDAEIDEAENVRWYTQEQVRRMGAGGTWLMGIGDVSGKASI